MGFPNTSRLARARPHLEKTEGTLMPSPYASPLERFRWELCQKFVQYKIEHKLSPAGLAAILKVDKAKVSKILHHRIGGFSTDRLIMLYQVLNPRLRILVRVRGRVAG